MGYSQAYNVTTGEYSGDVVFTGSHKQLSIWRTSDRKPRKYRKPAYARPPKQQREPVTRATARALIKHHNIDVVDKLSKAMPVISKRPTVEMFGIVREQSRHNYSGRGK